MHHVSRKYFLCALTGLVGLVLLTLPLSCGNGGQDQEPLHDCPDELGGQVQASQWVRESVGIERYKYRADMVNDILYLDLLDEGGGELGKVQVRQRFDNADTRFGTMEAVLERQGEPPLRLRTRGQRLKGVDYLVQMTFERDGRRLHVDAAMSDAPCPAGPAAGEPPACVGAVPVDQPHYAMASCGLAEESWRIAGVHPEVTHLEYWVRASAVDTRPTTGGMRKGAPDDRFTLEILSQRKLTDTAEIDAWAEQVGVKTILGTTDEMLLRATFLDAPWQGELREQVAECLGVPLVTTQQALNGCRLQELDDEASTQERRQAVQACNSAPGHYAQDPWMDDEGDEGPTSDPCETGCSDGDPHMVSFDGYAFDFQGAGEFVLAEAIFGEPFMVQIRMQPMETALDIEACKSVSINTAIAAQIGERRIIFDQRRAQPVWVDGEPVELPEQDVSLPEDANFTQTSRRTFVLTWPGGERLQLHLGGGWINMRLRLPLGRRGQIAGLLGFFNGDPDDDFLTRDGETLAQPVLFEPLYRQFGESWRVDASESLFDYEAGEDTDTYTRSDFPSDEAGLDTLPNEAVAEARQTCRERGVNDGIRMDWCILDVVCSGDPDFADAHQDDLRPEAAQMAGIPPLKTTGDVRAIAAPGSVAATSPPREDVCPRPEFPIQVFTEARGHEIAAALTMDVSSPGRFDGGETSPTTIATGELVDSHLVHLVATTDNAGPRAGSVTFPGAILGVIIAPAHLAATDAQLGHADTSYPGSQASRGLEFDAGDWLQIDDDGRTLRVHLEETSDIDQLRVVTSALP